MLNLVIRNDKICKDNFNIVVNQKIKKFKKNEFEKALPLNQGEYSIYLRGKLVKTNNINIYLEDKKNYLIIYIDNFSYVFCYFLIMFMLMFLDFRLAQLYLEWALLFELIIGFVTIMGATIFLCDLIFLGRQISVVEMYNRDEKEEESIIIKENDDDILDILDEDILE